MAYDSTQDQTQDDDDQQRTENQPAGNPITQISGGGGGFEGQGGASTTGAPTSAAASNIGKPTSSGSWTNLNSYLDANSDQAPALGSTIANNVGTQAAQSQSDLNNVVSGFQNQTPFSNINSTSDSTVDSSIDNAGQYAPTTDNGITTAANITQPETYLNDNWGITPTDSDITQYAPTTTTETPSTDPSWSTVQNDYTTANQNLQDTQSESGRDVLLQDQYGQNGQQYDQGEQGFDQLLLEQNPANTSALNNVYNQYAPGEVIPQASTTNSTQNSANQAGLPLDLYNAEQNANNYVTNEQNAATGFQTEASNDLTNQISSLASNLTGETNTDSTNFQNTYNQLLSEFQNNQIPASTLAQLGLTSGEYLYGANPDSYLTENANPYSGTGGENAAATSGDWNNFSGLQALIGGYSGTNQATDQSQLAQIGLTGTQPTTAVSTTPYTFNNANFNVAQSAGQAAWNSAYNSAGPSTSLMYDVNGNPVSTSAADLQNMLTTGTYNGNPIDAGTRAKIEEELDAWNAANPQGNQLGNGITSTGSGVKANPGSGGAPTKINPVVMQ